MKNLLISLFFLGFCNIAYGMEKSSLIKLRHADNMYRKFTDAGFGDIAEKTRIHTRFGGQTCHKEALKMVVAHIANQYLVQYDDVEKSQKRRKEFEHIVFVECVTKT